MNNEIKKNSLMIFQSNDKSYQRVSPKMHRHNLTEQAIQIWDNCFKAGLASVDHNQPSEIE